MNDPQIECRPMTGTERLDAFALYRTKIIDEPRLAAALALFVEREDLGMIWLALVAGHPVGACAISYEIGLPVGAIVARISELVVEPGLDRTAIATALLESLRDWLRTRGIVEVNAEGAFA
jgi:GNAT superfamily N-acetyltransferase